MLSAVKLLPALLARISEAAVARVSPKDVLGIHGPESNLNALQGNF
jgi:hypothetical protein